MFASLEDQALINCLNQGGVVIIPTDTLYGIVARASDKQAVERIYTLRGRAPEKPCIILAAGPWQITDTHLWTDAHRAIAAKYWPGAVSLVAPTATTQEYLHRGTHTLAYRVPADSDLRALLTNTGMLVAPSANPESSPPATTLQEAQAYFGDRVDGYVDGGAFGDHEPSTLVTLVDGAVRVLREGAVRVEG
ncbi:MAG TPA: L-threonylcarbamoyladenylate synthase [Magnetospirillaceae bacterium]|nr:L-threonylcarbamoyladenylate synthase [Magnetospirillaceae bacterium]